MSKTVSIDSASAAELETPNSMEEAMETGFLPDDAHYRLTGEFKSEKTDDSASSTTEKKPAKEDASAASTEDTEKQDQSEKGDASAASSSKAAPSESAQPQNQGRENRWQKRERELKELREKVARLEGTSRTETRSDNKQASQAATETSTAKAAPKPKIDDVDPKTGKPKYKNYDEWLDAYGDWRDERTIQRFKDEQSKTQQSTVQAQEARQIKERFDKLFEPMRAKYPDFDAVALSENLVIPKGSVTDLFMLDSDHAGEVAYYLGKHPEILQGFYRDLDPKTGKFTSLITPQQQFRKLMAIEAQVVGSGSGTGANGNAGDNSSSSSARPVTQASRPPHQVSGKGTVAKDAVEQALDDGDFETYQRAQNAKELARLKRK